MVVAAVVLALVALAAFGPSLLARYEDYRLQRMTAVELEALVKRQPRNTQALYRLGVAYSRDNRYREATKTFLNVLDRDPVRADVLNDLGVTYLMQERYYESLVALNGALTARPNYAAAYANLGRLHLATKMPFTAARELEHAVQYGPGDAGTLTDLGEAYQKTLNLQAAKRSYQAAIRLKPRYLAAYVGLGQAEYGLAQFADAEQTLNRALALAPNDGQTLLTLARLRMDKASTDTDRQGVEELLERAARAAPDNPEVWYDRGRLALQMGKAADAVTFLKKALEISPAHDSALHQLERALRAAGQTAEADRAGHVFQERALHEREETHLEEVVTHHPDDWDSQARLAQNYLETGQRGLALLVYRRVLAGSPHHPALPKLQQALNREFAAAPATAPGAKGLQGP
jgi:tetratricopeptide (TPR) repeat protein